MEEKELNVLLEKVDSKVVNTVKAEIQAAMTGIVKTDELTAKLNELKVNDLTIKEIADAVKSQGEIVRRMEEEKRVNTPLKSLPELIKENAAKFKAFQETKNRQFFNIPVVRNKTTVTINSSIVTNPGGYLMPGLNDTGLPVEGLEQAFTQINLPSDHNGIIRYRDLTTRTNNAAMIAEGAQQSSAQTYVWTGASKTVEKALAIVPVSYESLNDSTEMEMAIRSLLQGDIMTVKETQLYTGTGTAPQIAGVYASYATDFAHASYTGPTVDAANIFDLLDAMRLKAILAVGKKYMPNVAVLNPAQYFAATHVKDELGNYVKHPMISADGVTYNGFKLIQSAYVTDNTCVIGDSRYGYLYLGDNVEIEIGYDGNDFSYDQVSLKARHRFALVIRTADAAAWYKCTDIAAALAAITTPTA